MPGRTLLVVLALVALVSGGWMARAAEEAVGDRLPLLLAQLRSPQELERAKAAQELSRLQDRRAIEPLVELLLDPQPSVRLDAAVVLHTLHDPRGLPALFTLARQGDEQTRTKAVGRLGYLDDLRAIDVLVELLVDDTPAVPDAAAHALQNLATAFPDAPEVGKAVEPLIALARRTQPMSSATAIDALGTIGDRRAVEPLIGLLHADQQESILDSALIALVRIDDPPARMAVLALARGENRKLRDKAITLYGMYARGDIAPLIALLTEMAQSPDLETRRTAVFQLGQRDYFALQPLARALRDPEASVRANAASGLGRHLDPRVIPLLLPVVTDPDTNVAGFAIQGLGYQRDPRIAARALELVAQADPELRRRGCRLLDKYMGEEETAALLARLRDADAGVRTAAARSLLAESSRTLPVEAALAAGTALLQGTELEARLNGITLLGRVKDARAMAPLSARLLQGEAKEYQPIIAALRALSAVANAPDSPAVTALLPLARQGDTADRVEALRALGDFPQDSRAVDALLVAVRDGEPKLPAAAVYALEHSTEPRVLDGLLAALRSAQTDVVRAVLSRIEPYDDARVLQAVAPLLRHPDDTIQRFACLQLGRSHQPAAAQALADALRERLTLPIALAYASLDTPRELVRRPKRYRPAVYTFDNILQMLGGYYSEKADPLCALLTAPQPAVRVAAMVELGRRRDAQALPSLQAALQAEEAPVRWAAARALGCLEDPRACPVLLAALQSPDPRLRGQAAWALGQIRDLHTRPALLAALDDADVDVQFMAAHALGMHQATQAVKPLCRLLRHADAGVRAQAAWALGEIGDQQAVAPLLTALRDADEPARVAAAESLGKLGDRRAAGPLLALVNSLPSKDTFFGEGGMFRTEDFQSPRTRVLHALGTLDDPLVVEPLLKTTRRKNNIEHYAALQVLDRYPEPRVIEALITSLGRPDWQYTRHTTYTLSKIGLPAVEPLLAALHGDETRRHRPAIDALKYIYADRPADPRVRDRLAGLLATEVCHGDDLASLLCLLGDERGFRALAERTQAGTTRMYTWINALQASRQLRALDDLVPLLARPDLSQSERINVLYAMKAVAERHEGTPELNRLVEPLLTYLKNPQADGRNTVIAILGYLHDPRIVPALRLLLPEKTSHDAALEALIRLADPAAEDLLLASLQDPTSPWQYRAASVLGNYRDRRAVEALTTLLHFPQLSRDDDRPIYDVHNLAAASLATIGDPHAIPALIAALETGSYQNRQGYAAALKSLTGQDFGTDIDQWRAWEQRR